VPHTVASLTVECLPVYSLLGVTVNSDLKLAIMLLPLHLR